MSPFWARNARPFWDRVLGVWSWVFVRCGGQNWPRRGLRDIQAGMPACGVSRWRETPFPPPWPLQFSKQLRLACPKTEQHSQTCARTQWQVEDGEKTKQNKGQTLRYLSVRRKRASYSELILGTVFALEIKIFKYNDYSVARCHEIQKAEHGVR